MTEVTDAMTELVKLKKIVDKLRPLADAGAMNLEGRKVAEAEVIEWKRIGTEAVQEKDKAIEELEKEKNRATDATRNFEQQAKDIIALEKKVASMQMNAKYDVTAREGQVKRSRIIQTELEETRGENQMLETRNNELEAVNKELEKSRNHERALRLQDLHRNSTMAGAKKVAELHETEMEQRAAQISGELMQSREEVGRLRAEVLAAERVAKDHDLEMIMVRDELETERRLRLNTDSQLQNTIVTLEASVRAQRELEMEVSRLRSEIIKDGALIGSHTQMMKAQPSKNRPRNGRQGVASNGWSEQLALEAMVTKGSSKELREPLTESLGQATQQVRASWQVESGKQHFTHQETRAPDAMSLKQVLARPEGQESREGMYTIGSRRRNGRISRSAEEVPQYTQTAAVVSTSKRDHEIVHPGSLFVGSGLGLRKEQMSTKSVSSREMLKNILAGN